VAARASLLLAIVALAVALPARVRAQVEEEVEGGGVFIPEDEEAVPADPIDEGAPTDDGTDSETDASAPRPLVIELAPARDPNAPIAPEPLRFTLANGMQVILAPVPGRRFVAVAVTYDVGASDAPSGWSGLAHLTEHLMFSGTDELNEVEVYLRLEAAGAVERNGETTVDRSIFYEMLPASQLEWAFWIESQRMARMLAGLTEARVARQRQVVLHEGWERGAYGWRGLLAHQLYAGIFSDSHPYAAIVERDDDVRAISLRHVQTFFQQHYGPDDATLVVVGGFDPEVVRASVERYFAPIVRSAPRPPAVELAPVAPLDHERRITVEIQDERDRLFVAWPTPALYEPGDAECDVLAMLLSQRRDAPIRAALLESGLALDVFVRQRSHAHGSMFVIEAVPSPGVSISGLLQAIDGALARVRAEPFDEEAVSEARGVWERQMRLGAEDLIGRAVRLGGSTEAFVPTLDAELRRYHEVSAEDVRGVVRDWLPPDRRLILVGAANPDAPPRGRLRQDERVAR
jgi:zinc protease